MIKKYYKNDLIEILNKIQNCENALESIKIFQNMLWDDNEIPDLELGNNDREVLLDLALDLDFFGQNVTKKDRESGIKDINEDKEELLNLINNALEELYNSKNK